MKILIALILFCLSSILSYSQDNFTLNQGGTTQTNYYTELSYEDIRWAPIIKVNINGKEYRFLLDTGAPNAISKKLFDELKPEVIKKVTVADANNYENNLNIVRLKEIKIGTVTFHDIPTAVPNDPFFFDCLGVDGFIGSNLLRNSILQLSSKSRKMIITDQPEKLKLQNKKGTEMYLTTNQSLPLVTLEYLGKGSGSIPTLFDTGSAGFIEHSLSQFMQIEQAQVFDIQAKGKGKSTLGLYGFGKDTTQYRLKLPELKINGTSFKNVNLITTLGDNSTIGSRVLDYGVVTLNYIDKKFYFEPYEANYDLSEGLFPVSLIPVGNQLHVGTIWEEKLKEKLTPGDQVIAIDGIDYSTVSSCDIIKKEAIFIGKTQAILTLRDTNGKTRKVTILKSR
jgi:hypothetical protein